MSFDIAYANTYAKVQHDSFISKPNENSYKVILNSFDATLVPGQANYFAFHVDLPNLVMEGTYDMYVDNFLMEGFTTSITNVGIMELLQSRSFASHNNNNTKFICSILGSSLQKDLRPIQITDMGLFSNKTLTVVLTQFGNTSQITSNFQLTLVFEKRQ